VELELDGAANGLRLRIRDLETGACACVDAFALRSLALLAPGGLAGLCAGTVPADGA